jgi:hypothetical protein
MVRFTVVVAAISLALGLAADLACADEPATANDYPTAARADYVFACMQVNGRTPEGLEKCSCSIDAIAAVLPYSKYEEAETILSMRQLGGDKGAIFRGNPQLKGEVDDLRRAQVEGELRCF